MISEFTDPLGKHYRVLHEDYINDVYTVERVRRFRPAGRAQQITGEALRILVGLEGERVARLRAARDAAAVLA